jgi:uncharacterized protein (TIGR03067 family)
MRTIPIALLLGLAVLTISPARAEDNPAIKKDMAQLQGEWSMVSGTADGQPMPDALLGSCRRICKDDGITVLVGGQLMMKAKISIDPSKKPRTIDYEVTGGPNKGKRQLGIYELDGDTFKSCFGAPGDERPADFASKSGDRRTSSVWKRTKDAATKEK